MPGLDLRVHSEPFRSSDGGGYRSTKLRLNVNDMVRTYTDSLSEAVGADGKMPGTQGVCDIVNTLSSTSPELLIPSLLDAMRKLNSGNLKGDDTTVMLLRPNGSGVPFIENLKAPFRILKGLWQHLTRLCSIDRGGNCDAGSLISKHY